MMLPPAHVGLVIEDDPHIAKVLGDLVESLGHRAIVATTLEEVRAAIEAGGYCYVLLDMQIPATAGATPQVGCGETALVWLRAKDARFNADGRHWLQILVVSAYSREPEFVDRLRDMDANGFIAKTFGNRVEVVLDRIRGALARAGRADHAACEGRDDGAGEHREEKPQQAGEAKISAKAAVTLIIDGEKKGRTTGFLVNGTRCALQDLRFLVLLKLVVAHRRAPASWVGADDLGIARRPDVPSRLRAAFAGALPEGGFVVVEGDGNAHFRLNQEIVVERVDWDALEQHSIDGVKKVASEGRRLR